MRVLMFLFILGGAVVLRDDNADSWEHCCPLMCGAATLIGGVSTPMFKRFERVVVSVRVACCRCRRDRRHRRPRCVLCRVRKNILGVVMDAWRWMAFGNKRAVGRMYVVPQ